MAQDDLLERRRPACLPTDDEGLHYTVGSGEDPDGICPGGLRHGHRAEARLRLEDRRVESELPGREDDDPVAGLLNVRDYVGRKQDRRSTSSHVGDQQAQEVPSGQGIEAGERLVEQQEWCPRSQRQGQRDLGLFAARELTDPPLMVEADRREMASGYAASNEERAAPANVR